MGLSVGARSACGLGRHRFVCGGGATFARYIRSF